MHITYLSIFPELFDSFRQTTIVSRAVADRLVRFETINPRHFCDDKHRIIDDQIYGWWHGLLMKAPPIIESIKHWINKHKLVEKYKRQAIRDKKPTIDDLQSWRLKPKAWTQKSFQIIIPHPSRDVFTQAHAHIWSEYTHLLFICGRYEGIDERVRLWLQKSFPDHISRVSLWQFVTLGGELPAMTMTESIIRLIPGAINTEDSRKDESYSIDHNLNNLEYSQYTRPEIVEWMSVPPVLLSGHHKDIAQRKKDNSTHLS